MATQTVIQEMPSTSGFFKTNKIKNIEYIRLQEDVNIFGEYKNTIALHLGSNRSPYHLTFFASEEQRIDCYNFLLTYRQEHRVTLEKYFYKETISDEEVLYLLKKKNYHLGFHIQHIYDKIFKKDFAVFAASDAFKMFSTAQQAAMLDKRFIFIPNTNNVALTWAKTINIPKEFKDYISPYQYYRVLINLNNEKFKITNSV